MSRKVRIKLVELHKEFVGHEGEESDLEMVVDLLEHLCRKVEEQENHAHSIT